MKASNPAVDKSYAFALRIVKLRRYLLEEKSERDLSHQVLRSGTSIGANVEEAIGGHSKKDFKHKLTIAYKEARETSYWLRLLRDSGFIEGDSASSLITDCEELLKIIGSTLVTLNKADDEN
ncbi:MAG: four helix bundle protein [Coraliomargarita sp.]